MIDGYPAQITLDGVDTIVLDASRWEKANDFYDAYLAAVGAPEWHGHNLDALWDSLTGGDINQRNPPFRIRITGAIQVSDDVREILRRFEALIGEAREAGHCVEVELLP